MGGPTVSAEQGGESDEGTQEAAAGSQRRWSDRGQRGRRPAGLPGGRREGDGVRRKERSRGHREARRECAQGPGRLEGRTLPLHCLLALASLSPPSRRGKRGGGRRPPPTRTPGVSGGPPCCPAAFSGVFLGAGLPESRTHSAALLPQLPLTPGKAMSRGSTGPPNDQPESHGVARHGRIQHQVTDRRKRWLQSTGPRLGVKFSHRILAKSKDI